jgi:hypothetical protein
MPTVSKNQTDAIEIAIHTLEWELSQSDDRGANVKLHLIKIINELRQRIGADDLDWDYAKRTGFKIITNFRSQ